MSAPSAGASSESAFGLAHAALLGDLAVALRLEPGLEHILAKSVPEPQVPRRSEADTTPDADTPYRDQHANLTADLAEVLPLSRGVTDILDTASGHASLVADLTTTIDTTHGLAAILAPPVSAEPTSSIMKVQPAADAAPERLVQAIDLGTSNTTLTTVRNPDPQTAAEVLSGAVHHDALKFVADAALAVQQLGDHGGAAAIRAEVDGLTNAATVVVAGEKQGKTSLVNALIGRPGLLPVNVDVATAVHVGVRYGAEPAARVISIDYPQGHSVPLDELARFAAMDPETGRAVNPDVLQVEVSLPEPLLQGGLSLIDTPGIGGLVAGRAAVTLAMLSRADALLYVVSAASELTASECQFLRRATERIATVVFVVTRIDIYPQWEKVLVRNQELVQEHVPRYAGAPWLAVSSRFKFHANRAANKGEHDFAAELRASSGIDPLLDLLSVEIAGRARQNQIRNSLRVAGRVVRRDRDTIHRRERSLSDDSSASQELTDLRHQLQKVDDNRSRWQTMLIDRSKVLDQELRRQFQRQLTALHEQFHELIRAGNRYLIERLADELAVAVLALWLDQETTLHAGLASLAADLVDLTDDYSVLALPFPMELRDPPGPHWPSLEGLTEQLGQPLPLFGLTSFAASDTERPVLGATAMWAPGPVRNGVIRLLHEYRRNKDETALAHQDATRYVDQILSRIDVDLTPAVQHMVDAALQRFRGMVIQGVEIRRGQLGAAIAEHERLRLVDVGERLLLRAQLAVSLATVDGLYTRFTMLVRALDDHSLPG